MKAINTYYNKNYFRSRAEARWAVFFNEAEIKYEYEKEGYRFDDGTQYLPDFYLPEVYNRRTEGKGIFVEVKGANISDKDMHKIELLVKESKKTVALLYGNPINNEEGLCEEISYNEEVDSNNIGWDNFMLFCKCYNKDCGVIKYEYCEGNYMVCPVCLNNCDNKHPDLERAKIIANTKRFEFQ